MNKLGIIYLAVFLIISALKPSRADTFIITDPSDTTNVTSLRGSIIAANAMGGANIIILTCPVYSLTIYGPDEDAGFAGDLDITNGSLTIVGASFSRVILDAAVLGDRVFQVFSNAQLPLEDLTITGGAGGRECSRLRR
jgi:hypothetical protein